MEYEIMDPSRLALVGTLDGCAGFIAGLVLLVVGFVTVRKALPVAGYLVGAAGGLQLLSSCCSNWQMPAAVWLDLYESTEVLGFVSQLGGYFVYLVSFVLLIVAGVMLAKAVPAAEGGAS